MSRSGYDDNYGDDDPLELGRYRGRVASAIRGKRGQAFMRDLLAALDAMTEKRLIAGDLEHEGGVCAIGALGRQRDVQMSGLDPEDAEHVAGVFNIAEPLAREVVFENDEAFYYEETPEQRWTRMRAWVVACIKEPA